MNIKLMECINDTFKQELGISYEEFELLDFDEQQKLIEENRKLKESNDDYVIGMVGSGENSIFVKNKYDDNLLLADGTFVIVGDTPEHSRNSIKNDLDSVIYSKPISNLKKLTRNFKRK